MIHSIVDKGTRALFRSRRPKAHTAEAISVSGKISSFPKNPNHIANSVISLNRDSFAVLPSVNGFPQVVMMCLASLLTAAAPTMAQVTCGCTYFVAGTAPAPGGNTFVDVVTIYNGLQTCSALQLPNGVCIGDGYCPSPGVCISRWTVCSGSCGGNYVNFHVSCGAAGQVLLARVFIPGRGPSGGCADDPYALTRGRIRGNGTAAKVPFRTRTRVHSNGVRGFLPGTVELFRWGLPSEQYRWRRVETNTLVVNGMQPSGSFIMGANSAHLTITNIDTPDEGFYVLEAAACSGCVYNPREAVRVHVERPIADIISMPQDRQACLGGTTNFLVIAEEPSGVSATYRWFRNGVRVDNGVLGGVGTVSGATTPVLTVSNLQAGAAGNYACHIITGSYINNTFDAALTISSNTTPPVVLAPPQSVTVAAETSAYMIADIDVQAGQVPSFQWRKDGVPIYDDGRIEGTQTEQLVFNRVIAGDVGQYDCVVTRGCASTTTAAAGLSLCIADYNNDGGIDGGDVEVFFGDWESGNLASDVNTDGGIDGTDVEVFFSRWEAGC